MEWEYKTARDHGLSPRARLASDLREPRLLESLAHRVWLRGLGLYLRWFHRLRVRGREGLPRHGPAIVIANHSSHLDALVLSHVLAAAGNRHAFALAAADVFFGSAASSLFAANAINALPIRRRGGGVAAILPYRERLLQDGLTYILFPEGTRSRDGSIGPFKPGIGVLVAASPVPVIPCYLAGAHAAWPADARRPRRLPLALAIGEPLRFDAIEDTPEGWHQIAATCEQAVRALDGTAPPQR